MISKKRNANVVAALIASLTLGAGVLLLMDPHPKPATRNASLLVAGGQRVASATLHYVGTDVDLSAYDYVVGLSGDRSGQPRGRDVHVAVVGNGAAMSDAQLRTVLFVLNELRQSYGMRDDGVRVGPSCDVRIDSTLSRGARDLFDILSRKQFIS